LRRHNFEIFGLANSQGKTSPKFKKVAAMNAE